MDIAAVIIFAAVFTHDQIMCLIRSHNTTAIS